MELSEAQVKNKPQIIHCSKRHHWIVASIVNCKLEEVRVYDALFSTIDKETRNIIQNSTSCKRLDIKLARCQKQTGGKDCGVFRIAFVTTIAFRKKMTKFHQELMRPHLVECINKSTCHHFLVSKVFLYFITQHTMIHFDFNVYIITVFIII